MPAVGVEMFSVRRISYKASKKKQRQANKNLCELKKKKYRNCQKSTGDKIWNVSEEQETLTKGQHIRITFGIMGL